MAKSLKPLVINTESSLASGEEYKWNKLQNAEVFVKDIKTPDVNIENSEELNKLISGIPTPFARAAMFRYAISYVEDDTEKLTGLMAFYKTLQDEWKGFVACLALDNQPITVEKIGLAYSDGKTAVDTTNMYEPKGALGNMLFEDTPLWCDQDELLDTTRRVSPFLYVIRYEDVVIGATAPESFLFTAPVYKLSTNKSFYSQKTRTFTDPLKANLSKEEVEKLYVYVKHINNSVNGYQGAFGRRKPDVVKLSVFLNRWLGEIRSYAAKKGYTIDENAIIPNLDKFGAPFDRLFNFKTTLYGYNGRISSDLRSLQLPEGVDAVEVELPEILLNPDRATVAEVMFDDPARVVECGVHFLKAISDRGDRYFTLPLSEKGLAIFQDEMGALLKAGGELRSNLSAVYDMATKTLHVTLKVDVNGNVTSYMKSYREPVRIEGQKVICWPDFISTIWEKYYLYSELPHNGPELKAFPLRADINGFRLIATNEIGDYGFKKIAVNGKKVDAKDAADILVEYDINKLGSSEFRYEIYESAEPFKGLEFQFKNRPAGYLILASNALKDYRSLRTNPNPVRVGFDFGSNNTCVSFAEVGEPPELLTYRSRRRFLLGVEVPLESKAAAAPNQVFFFQNESTASNQIKSMVMIHDERRVRDFASDPKIILKREVKGGFPVFEKNLPVEDSSETAHTIRFAGQASFIKYNMKWSTDEKENAHKQGLLKTLWLKTYAELLEREKFPETIVWAYPSSMNKQILLKYSLLWKEVGQLSPLVKTIPNASVAQFAGSVSGRGATEGFGGAGGGFGSGGGGFGGSRPSFGSAAATASVATALDLKAQTEAAAVCKHALGVGFEAGQKGLILGFDIGGSTTDILCIATRKDSRSATPDDFKDTLIKQSSVKFAAGRLADATRRSKKFQEVLRSFCLKKGMHVHGINVPPERLNANTSTYYYNLIVDRLESTAELDEFYQNLAGDCPELFTVNAYMTGLIMFYAGQLARKVRLAQDAHPADYFAPFDQVQVGCFGKGGRMFDWLRAVNAPGAFNYYQQCFGAGYGPKAAEHINYFEIRPSDPDYVKAEVSFGLSRSNEIHITTDQISELVGEDGYTYNGAAVDEFDAVEPRFMQHFGNQFFNNRSYRRFTDFAKLFEAFAREFFGVSLPALGGDISGMKLRAYIENIPEYQLAKRAEEFDFEAPVIMLEGMCFLDTVLLPKLFGA